MLPGSRRNGAARPLPGDYGLTLADLDIPYAPGRAGVALGVLIALVTALAEAFDQAAVSRSWLLGGLGGLLYGAMLGTFGALGLIALLYWVDPLIGRAWPTYGRLRRYREALAAARRAEAEHGG